MSVVANAHLAGSLVAIRLGRGPLNVAPEVAEQLGRVASEAERQAIIAALNVQQLPEVEAFSPWVATLADSPPIMPK